MKHVFLSLFWNKKVSCVRDQKQIHVFIKIEYI